jgi:hypothetical protein
VYSVFVGKAGKRTPLGRPIFGWMDSIKMDLREIGWGDTDWTYQPQGKDHWRALVNTVIKLLVHIVLGSS